MVDKVKETLVIPQNHDRIWINVDLGSPPGQPVEKE